MQMPEYQEKRKSYKARNIPSRYAKICRFFFNLARHHPRGHKSDARSQKRPKGQNYKSKTDKRILVTAREKKKETEKCTCEYLKERRSGLGVCERRHETFKSVSICS